MHDDDYTEITITRQPGWWIESNVRVQWWNPLTWIAWMWLEKQWFLVRSYYDGVYVMAIFKTREEAEAALAEQAKEEGT